MKTTTLIRTVLIVGSIGACGLAAISVPNASALDVGRYAWSDTPAGLARLDTATGAVALCTRSGERFECSEGPLSDTEKLREQLRQLESRNRALEAQVARLEADVADRQLDAMGTPELKLPSEEDVDKVMGFLDRTLKRFRDMMRDLKESDSNEVPL